MSYDFEGSDKSPPKVEITPWDPEDLEAIVTLLELAAITLTKDPEGSFTEEELLQEACEYCGGDFQPSDVDMKIVLSTATFLKRDGARLSLK
jgi:hypothetical protein